MSTSREPDGDRLRRLRPRPLRGPAPRGVPHGRRAGARPGPGAGGAGQDLRRLAAPPRPQQGRGLLPQGDHHHRDLLVPAPSLEPRAHRRATCPSHAGPGSDLAGGVAQSQWLWDALQALPVRQRISIVLRYYEDLTEAQTAEAMGCAVGTVKSQVSAGHRAAARRPRRRRPRPPPPRDEGADPMTEKLRPCSTSAPALPPSTCPTSPPCARPGCAAGAARRRRRRRRPGRHRRGRRARRGGCWPAGRPATR